MKSTAQNHPDALRKVLVIMKSPVRSILKVLAGIALGDVVVMILVGAFCWFTGRHDWAIYGEALMWSGFIVAGLGTLGLGGNVKVTRSFGYQYSSSVQKRAATDRIRQDMTDLITSYRWLLIGLLTGGSLIGIGWALYASVT